MTKHLTHALMIHNFKVFQRQGNVLDLGLLKLYKPHLAMAILLTIPCSAQVQTLFRTELNTLVRKERPTWPPKNKPYPVQRHIPV